MNAQQVKEIILNSPAPLLLKNIIKWDILDWSLDDWKELLENEEMEFRRGNFHFSKEPQWENQTPVVKGKFDFFLNHIVESDPKQWLYFDYKYLNHFLMNATDLRNVHTILILFLIFKYNFCRILGGMQWVFLKQHMMKALYGLGQKELTLLVILIHMDLTWFVKYMEGK